MQIPYLRQLQQKKYKFMKKLFILLIFSCCFACNSNKNDEATDSEEVSKSYLETAREELGMSATCEESEDRAFVLCKYIDKSEQSSMAADTTKEAKGYSKIKYFVWDTRKGLVVNKGVMPSGQVVWHSNTTIKITELKGDDTLPSMYLYDVVSGTKTAYDGNE